MSEADSVSEDPKLGWEPAHPTTQVKSDYGELLEPAYSGLTKRELFAAMAMQGICACPSGPDDDAELASYAVRYADALLKELAK